MPIVNVVLLEGRTQAQKDSMYREVTDALCRSLDCRPDQVRIIVQETANGDFAVAGTSVAAVLTQRAQQTG